MLGLFERHPTAVVAFSGRGSTRHSRRGRTPTLWLRIAKRFDFAYTLERLAFYRLHDDSIRGHRLDWNTDELRVWLRHVDDVHDPATRRLTVEQIRRAHVLLQEELLRVGVRDEEHMALLHNEFAPGTARYRLGQLVIHGPRWLGRSYAAAIRTVGGRAVARPRASLD